MLVAIFREDESHALFLLQQEGITRLDLLNYISHGIAKDGRTARSEARERRAAAGEDEEGEAPQKDPLEAYCTNLSTRRRRRGASIRSSAARRSWSAPSRCSAAAGRTTRSTWARPAWARRPSPRGWRCASTRSKVPERAQGRDRSSRWTWARCSPAPSSAASSRSGSRRVLKALQKQPGRHPLHRRDPHHRRRRRDQRRLDGRVEPAQAGAGQSGKLRCIGSTTYQEYKASFERDRALSRRFQKIEVGEPTVEDTVLILEGLKSPLRGAPRRDVRRGRHPRRRGARRPSTSTTASCRTRPST